MSNGVRVTSEGKEKTKEFARKIAATLRGGETLALIGELGSGKTTFVKALAKALGVKKPVRSPTFVLMVPYRARRVRWLLHVDAYRIKNPSDLEAIGIHDYLGRSDTVTVIEWADRVTKILPREKITVRFFHGLHKSERRLSLFVTRPRGRLRQPR